MQLVALVVVGFTVALSVFHLFEAVMRMRPDFDRATVLRFGPGRSALLFALCGPVLMVRQSLAPSGARNRAPWPITSLFAAGLWAALIGLIAVELGRLIAAS